MQSLQSFFTSSVTVDASSIYVHRKLVLHKIFAVRYSEHQVFFVNKLLMGFEMLHDVLLRLPLKILTDVFTLVSL